MNDRVLFQVEDVFFIEGVGTIAAGKLITGIAKIGMKSIINGKQSEILRIESHHKSVEYLKAGVPGGLFLSNIKKNDIQKGKEYHFQ